MKAQPDKPYGCLYCATKHLSSDEWWAHMEAKHPERIKVQR